MTDEQLKQLRELVAAGKKATPGKWSWIGKDKFRLRALESDYKQPNQYSKTGFICPDVIRIQDDYDGDGVMDVEETDADFITAASVAREALSALLAERDAMKAVVDTEREMRVAAEAHNMAVAALCRGEKDTPCAMHVSAPILRLVAVVEAAKAALKWRRVAQAATAHADQGRYADHCSHRAVGADNALDAALRDLESKEAERES